MKSSLIPKMTMSNETYYFSKSSEGFYGWGDGINLDKIDKSSPMFYGSKKYGKKVIEVLETFGGINYSWWSCDEEFYVYAICELDGKRRITCIPKNELPISELKESGILTTIEDFLGINENE